MGSGLYGSNDSRLSSKAGAMEFAIVMNTTSDEKGRAVVNYKEVKRMFDFICRNVKLPDLPRDSMGALSDGYVSLMQSLVKECAAKKEDK
jgi:hypothetical protein